MYIKYVYVNGCILLLELCEGYIVQLYILYLNVWWWLSISHFWCGGNTGAGH